MIASAKKYLLYLFLIYSVYHYNQTLRIIYEITSYFYLTKYKNNDIIKNKDNRKIIKTAKFYLKTPYLFGGNTKKGIDCSALIKNVYSKNGISLPRTAWEQYWVGKPIHIKELLKPGDIIFFRGYKAYRPSHCGIYIKNGLFIHANSVSGKVEYANLNNNKYYKKIYVGARRI